MALAPAVVQACYHYVALTSAPAPGAVVQVELNDAGRVGLAGAVGPEAGKIEGRLESSSDTGFVVRVAQVLGEYGGVTRWEGEPVAIRPDYVRTLRERRFSAARTAVLAAATGAGLVAFAASRNLLGFGGQPSSSDSIKNGNKSQ